jgi:hypothetical protein
MKHNQNNSFKPIRTKEKICANHPVSHWKEGYKRCYWGFKLGESCKPLEKDKEEDGNI